MHKILLGAIIVAAILLAYPSLMTPQQSFAQTTTNDATDTNGGGTITCNTSIPNHGGSYLTIDGINGPNGSPCAFEIKDFSFGVESPTTIGSGTGGAGSGKVQFDEFTIQKTTDSASPVFFKNCVAGSHYGQVTLYVRKAGGTQMEYLTFTFQTVFTTKIQWSGPGDESPTESITFEYGSLSVDYHPQK
jgi:type VI secretion system Hcp family effector